VFRGKFLEGLEEAFASGQFAFCGSVQQLADPKQFQRLLDQLSRKKWVVYAKAPFGGPEHVLQYLAHYTHRVAISNPVSPASMATKSHSAGKIMHTATRS